MCLTKCFSACFSTLLFPYPILCNSPFLFILGQISASFYSLLHFTRLELISTPSILFQSCPVPSNTLPVVQLSPWRNPMIIHLDSGFCSCFLNINFLNATKWFLLNYERPHIFVLMMSTMAGFWEPASTVLAQFSLLQYSCHPHCFTTSHPPHLPSRMLLHSSLQPEPCPFVPGPLQLLLCLCKSSPQQHCMGTLSQPSSDTVIPQEMLQWPPLYQERENPSEDDIPPLLKNETSQITLFVLIDHWLSRNTFQSKIFCSRTLCQTSNLFLNNV